MTKLSPNTDEIVLTITRDQYQVRFVVEGAEGEVEEMIISIPSCPITKFRTVESRALAELKSLRCRNPRLTEFPRYMGTYDMTYRMTLEEFKECAHVD